MLMLLRVHVTSVLFLDNLPQLWASIGVTCSYSSHPFLCALALGHCTFWTRLWILIWKVRPLSVKARRLCEIWKSISDDPDVYFQAATCNSASMQGTLKVGNFRGGGKLLQISRLQGSQSFIRLTPGAVCWSEETQWRGRGWWVLCLEDHPSSSFCREV